VTRNWDLIRRILVKLDELGDAQSVLEADQVPPYDVEIVSFHMRALLQAGLIEGECADYATGVPCRAFRLTWQGMEFLDQVRVDKIWNRIKETIRSRGLAMSLDIIKSVAATTIAGALKGG
jgi:hypothetical protein